MAPTFLPNMVQLGLNGHVSRTHYSAIFTTASITDASTMLPNNTTYNSNWITFIIKAQTDSLP